MTLEERAAKHYPNSSTYQSQWLRMVTLLGPKWLLAKYVTRIA